MDGAAGLATALAFRLKLALSAGFAPELAGCARCGESGELHAFSGAAGGVVCWGVPARRPEISAEAHRFMLDALGRPLARACSDAAGVAGRRRRSRSTLEHHAHVQLRAAA